MKKLLFLSLIAALSASSIAHAQRKMTKAEYLHAYEVSLQLNSTRALMAKLHWNIASAWLQCGRDLAVDLAKYAGEGYVEGVSSWKTLLTSSYEAATTEKRASDVVADTKASFELPRVGYNNVGAKDNCEKNTLESKLIFKELVYRNNNQ